MPHYQWNDHTLFYRTQGEGPVLLILPGDTATSICYQGEMDYFSDRFRTIAPDFWGTGQSERMDVWPVNWWEQAAFQMGSLVDHLNVENCLVMGSSGGAIVSARVEWVHRAHDRTGVPLTVRRAEGVIDPATGTITATWAATGGTTVPPWVGVYYRWDLRDEAGNEYTTDRAEAEYTPTDPDQWNRAESDEVLVFSKGLPDDMGDLVLQAMDFQRQKYVDGWGEPLPYRPRVILFGDMTDWLEWQIGHQDTTGLGVITVGMTSDEWGGTVQVLYGLPHDLAFGTVLHEVEHLYQREFLAKRVVFTPGWSIEGDSSFYQEDDIDAVASDHVYRWVVADGLPTLLQGDGPTITGADALNGYYMGYEFFKYLDLKWGIAIHRQIMTLLGQNVSFTDAVEQATGMSVVELERAWRAWLGATSDAPTLIPTWTPPAFWPSPTPMSFGAK